MPKYNTKYTTVSGRDKICTIWAYVFLFNWSGVAGLLSYCGSSRSSSCSPSQAGGQVKSGPIGGSLNNRSVVFIGGPPEGTLLLRPLLEEVNPELMKAFGSSSPWGSKC
ncbi:unnamed protein product [Sphenostylis stenocarpa]|uniref:Uncharacterized protein n=1 Tax=Sphenostylis stenocarpa TaxID=92480 RepID=A0AA86VA53_9FABA|nr:unnamed protein product [Sphenostylis stenocarpa]